MTSLLDHLLSLPATWVYLLVGLVVFAEDAVFVGFVVPGETAAVLAGVDAHSGHVGLVAAIAVVVVAAVAGDGVGYEVGKHLGTRVLSLRFLERRRERIDAARGFLARHGGSAVFLGRFVAFFRAVMPALAGTARMPYRRFLPWNALGGLVWGAGFVLVGYLAGASYSAVAGRIGTGTAIGAGGLAVAGLVVWRVRRHRRGRAPSAGSPGTGEDAAGEHSSPARR
jgi:membrane protein DedA with SNARE-associated domain